jgi:hypothetical protein
MFIGSGIGIRPCRFATIWVWAMTPCPSSINVYSDGAYYDTIYPLFLGPISARFYPLNYYEKGFHTLTFVAADNSSHVEVDVQIGPSGFIKNILPYLLGKAQGKK